MKNKICQVIAVALCASLLITGCGSGNGASGERDGFCGELSEITPKEKLEGNPLVVEKVENLPERFIMGVDASSVISMEDSGVKYYNYDGVEQDVFLTLAQNGVTHIRVRVWVDPYDADGNGYGGGNCDAEKAARIGERAAAAGLRLIVDLQYSDFWADPGKQRAPKAWDGMSLSDKETAVYEYTKETLQTIQDRGGVIGLVQVGNETNGSLCGETEMDAVCSLFSAGSRGVREICPDALVVLHFANPEKEGSYAWYAKELADREVDYDVFGTSYYPYWHGTLENLTAVLKDVADTYGKKTMVMETAYPYTLLDSDYHDNTVNAWSKNIALDYSCDEQGQAEEVRDVIQAAVNAGSIGVCYWEGTWISVGGGSKEENSVLWEKYGSGWASSYAAQYDPDDAGKYYGGCAVENQALFDREGKPLKSLQVFNLVRYGNP